MFSDLDESLTSDHWQHSANRAAYWMGFWSGVSAVTALLLLFFAAVRWV